jgi:hypothetical protein
MKSKGLGWTARAWAPLAMTALALLAIGLGGLTLAHAGDEFGLPTHFSGLLNDYTPPAVATPPAPTVPGGPYEMHGKWSMQLSERGTATFSAEMTMETADFANTDANHDPTKLGPHTHHISVTDGVIHNDLTELINWKAVCPTFKPPVTGGFVVTGTAYVTGNGGNPPFGNPSAVTICILGGMQNPSIATAQAFVEFSNFTLTFGSTSLAATHFGTQAINGVVLQCDRPRDHRSNDCRVSVVE